MDKRIGAGRIATGALAVAGLLAVGLYWVGGEAAPSGDGSGPEDAQVDEAPADEAEAAWSLAGRVVSRDRQTGVAGARVIVDCEEARPLELEAGRDGGFRAYDLPPGPCEVSASAEGWSVGGPRAKGALRVEIPAEGAAPRIELPLSRTGRISGRVVRGGRPVEGVPLSVLHLDAPGSEGPFHVQAETASDARGRFTLDGLLPGRLQVLAEPADGELAESDELELPPGGVIRGVHLALPSGGRLVGWVVDSDDRPVEGARILVYAPGLSKPKEAHSDGDGAFAVDGLPEATVRLAVTKAGFAPARRMGARIETGEVNEILVELEASPGFRGMVLGPDGEPVGRAEVHVRPWQPEPGRADPPPETHTHPDGHFVVTDVERFPVRVHAEHPALGPSDPVQVVRSGEEITLRLAGGGGALSGRVVDEHGHAVSSYQVVAMPTGPRRRRGVTKQAREPEGRFLFSGLNPGTYDVLVRAEGRAPVRSEDHQVSKGRQTDVGAIVLPRQAVIVGRVVDAESGEPLADVRVRAQGAEVGRGRGSFAETGRDGAFRLERVPVRRMSLALSRHGYTTRIVSGVQPAAGDTVEVGVVDLLPTDGKKRRMEYGGIGAVLEKAGDGIFFRRIFEGSAAGEAGLEPGTRITSVAGRSIEELGLRGALELLRGEPDTPVSLTIVPKGGGSPRQVEIRRRMVTTP